MKKELILVSLLIAILFVIVGCCKDGECKKDKKDYRNKWVGEYYGEYESYFTCIDPSVSWRKTQMITFSVSVWGDSCLFITNGETQWKPEVNTDGYLLQSLERSFIAGIVFVDSISFFGIFMKSQGGTWGYEFKGKKQ